jgi:hypothetical protein
MKRPRYITVIDEDTGRVLARNDISTVPEALRFADTPEGRVSVVKVIVRTRDDRREIKEYGPNDELLRTSACYRSSR